MMKKLLLLLIPMLFWVIPPSPNNWYVNKAASGSNNGTNWTNAWTDFGSINFSTVACGDTIWVAAGTYSGSMTLSKVCTSGNVLTISAVLSSDTIPTSATGYSSAYAYPNQIVDNNGTISVTGNFQTIDGRAGDARTSVPYGFQYLYTGNAVDAICMQGPCGNNTTVNATNNTFRYMELFGPTCVTAGTCTGDTHAITDNGYSNTKDTNTTIDHVWFHRFAEVIRLYETTNFTAQYSYIGEDVTFNTDEHEDLVYLSDPVTGFNFIGNTWYSSGNDGIFMDNGGATNGLFVDNVFQHWGSWSLSFGKTGTCGPYIVVNNTFGNDGLGAGEGYTYGTIGTGGCTLASGSIWENNIFYNVANVGNANATLTYNAGTTSNGSSWSCGTGCFSYSNASPLSNFTGFVNFVPSGVGGGTTGSTIAVTADLHLSSAGITLFAGKGANLTSQCGTYPSFCTDKDGNARPSSGAWDLGAYNATASGNVTLSPSSQNFGSVAVGSSSSPVTFTLTNNSSTTATSISPTTTGGNSGDFTVTNSGAGSCSAAGGSIAATASCTFTVTFSPSATGSRSTTLSVSYSGGDSASPQTAALSGTGTAAPTTGARTGGGATISKGVVIK